MYLILYDIEAKRDPHGIRVRLVRSLRRNSAFQLQKSAWILEGLNEENLRIIDELRQAGGSVKVVEWLPRSLGEVSTGRGGGNKVLALAVMGSEPLLEGWDRKVKMLLEGLGYRVIECGVSESSIAELAKRAGKRQSLLLFAGKTSSRLFDEVSLLDVDGIVLLHSGRSAQSGIVFGSQIIANTKILRNMTSLPLLHLERPGKADGVLLVWNDQGITLGRKLASELGLPLLKPNLEAKMVTREGGREIRQIHFARMGDTIVVNGRKVGVCLADQIYLIAENGRLVDILGGKMLMREAHKLSFDNLSQLIVKTMNSA